MKKNLLIYAFTLSAFCLNAQIITTVSGGGYSGLGDGGPATSSQLYNCHGIDFDAAGNMYIADGNNNRIRKVAVGTGIITTIAGTGTEGFSGDGGPAIAAKLDHPWDLDVDGLGNIYIADATSNRIRKIDAQTGIITTIAGIPNPTYTDSPNGGYNGDGIAATSAQLWHPNGIAVDAAGNIYISDYYNNRVRKITASTGLISTIAGTGSNAYNGDGILATNAAVFGPNAVAVDGSGNVYISDNGSYRVRKITASTGLISTIAGNGSYGYSGDGVQGSLAQVVPSAIMLDASGNVYVTSNGSRIRKIDQSTGIITTIAGDGNIGFTGDGGHPLQAQFNNVNGLAFDGAGNIYIGDAGNNRIRKIDMGSSLTSIPDVDVASEANLYPNPLNTTATISVTKEQTNASLTIADLQGKIVSSFHFNGTSAVIERGQLTEGVYFITVLSQDGTTIRKKLIIN